MNHRPSRRGLYVIGWADPGAAGPMPYGPGAHGHPHGRFGPRSGQIPGMPGSPGMPGGVMPGGIR